MITTTNRAPKKEQINRILDFSKGISDSDSLLIHCHAGMSRSVATAILILIQHGRTIEDAFTEIQNQVPHMDPNILILEYGDELLCLDNKLLDYYKVWLAKTNKRERIVTLVSEDAVNIMSDIMSSFD